jgi:acyl-coenzyme A synthetase/AMP-(fatty) acid ligase
MNASTTSRQHDRLLAALPAWPRVPERAFVRAGASCGDVYRMAGWLLRYYQRHRDTAPVCLVAADRGVIAAALLASLAGGPPLLFPYGFSARILADIQRVAGYTLAIADRQCAVPEQVTTICPQPEGDGEPLWSEPPSPERVIVKLFTGGTTGSPQFWSKSAANLLLEAIYLAEALSVTSRDRIVATVSPYHIYGLLYSVLLPLVSSASVAAATPSFPAEITRIIVAEEATILISVPAHYEALQGKKTSTGTLRLAVSSAGMLADESNRDFFRRNQVDLAEIYGSTETGGVAGRYRSRGEEHFTFFPAIQGRLCGERLAVRSPYVSPEAPRDAQGFYCSGDRAVFVSERSFSLLGRSDHITKVGGNRVDLEEIRAAIKRQPGVVDGIALTVAAVGGREHQIVALVQGSCSADSLRVGLAQVLEPYALPRIIRFVDHLPRNDRGKYDRDAMLALFES